MALEPVKTFLQRLLLAATIHMVPASSASNYRPPLAPSQQIGLQIGLRHLSVGFASPEAY